MARYLTRMRKVSSALAIAVSVRSGAAQGAPPPTSPVPIPDSRVGHVLKAWSEAFNSGDSAVVRAYAAKYHPQMNVAGQVRLRGTNGGFDVVKILVNQPTHIEVVLKEKAGALGYARGTMEVGEADPPTVSAFMLRGVPPGAPPEGCSTYAAPPTTTAPGVANPKDVESEDAILVALYQSISGPACQHRDWDRFRSLFAPGARLIPTGLNADRKAVARAETPDEYANAAKIGLEEGGFFEHETARTGETFGAISHAFSTYESRRTANDEKPFARGINSIQLLNDGSRWWIMTVYWQAERPDSPIPPQFLPRKP
jgi:hypothetical protein